MATRSPNVRWQQRELPRARRWQALGAHGATLWLTGLPSSGKSTLGAALERRIVEAGAHAYLLDGDNLRHGICADLGFSHRDRERNVSRVGDIARLFADSGAIAIVALVSPYAATRTLVRERHEQEGLAFVEVFVNTPLWTCVERDPKGLYAQALAGRLDGFTGVDDPYEEPREPELELTPGGSLDEAADLVLATLDRRYAAVAAAAAAAAAANGRSPRNNRGGRASAADAVVA